jgi:hypothetical protein
MRKPEKRKRNFMKKESVQRHGEEETCNQAAGGFRYLTGICQKRFQAIKESIKGHLEAEYGNALDSTSIQQIVNEADALAADTAFPTLFLPTLAEEKARAVIRWQGKQRLLWAKNPSFAFAS